jgi:predicted HTH domain antitoxin
MVHGQLIREVAGCPVGEWLVKVAVSCDDAKLNALKLFVSLGRAAELSDTPLAAFMDFAATHGAPPLNYGMEQLEEDRRTLAKLRA